VWSAAYALPYGTVVEVKENPIAFRNIWLRELPEQPYLIE
jgi:hypothetical protein